MEPCDTETLASLCHLSQTHFRRLFLACMKVTPLQFVISTRIYQACLLLANTNDPVLSVAQAVGMPSASSFNRNFQQVMGMSPRQYRANSDRFRTLAGRKEQILPFKGWLLPTSEHHLPQEHSFSTFILIDGSTSEDRWFESSRAYFPQALIYKECGIFAFGDSKFF